MLKHATLLTLAATTALFATAHSASAQTLDDNKVVYSTNGTIVRNTMFGTCVRTKWENGFDICAPEPEEFTQVVEPPAVRTVLRSNEKTIYFAFDSAKLSAEAKQKLNTMAKTLSTAKDIRSADIVGYADRIGSNGYNEALSVRRANAVKNYLAGQGYLNTRIAEVRGLGESRPTADCAKSLSRSEQISCLSPDRRVEIEVLYTKTKRVSGASNY